VSGYHKRPDRIANPGPLLGRLRICRDEVVRASGAVKPFGVTYHGLSMVVVEGVVSKRGDRPHRPDDRGDWLKSKCLNQAEFVVIGWTDPDGARPYLGALRLRYFAPGRRLLYAGRVGTAMSEKTLRMLTSISHHWSRLKCPWQSDGPASRARRSFSPRFIGSDRSWSRKSPI
jgi:hypothetical protein